MKTPKFFRESIAAATGVLFVIMLALPFTMISQKAVSQSPLKDYNKDEDDKTLSPYFFVKSENPNLDQLPLKETKAEVNIAGVIADIKITQVYMNQGKNTLEAIYVFPASTRAAVYDMRMTIGGRVLIAKIQEKETARRQYEDAKNQGKSASLLEQERPNVFQMNVANIMPGDTINVEMHYTELLIPEGGIYEFVYPTVVGPRYSNKSEVTASADDKWVSNPYTHQGVAPTYVFGISAKINAGMKIKAISCPTHLVNIDYTDKHSANITLKKSETDEGNRDFILQYKLADNAIESGLLLFKGENNDENFFLAMIQPPAQPEISMVPPRDFIFIMDVSGSMYGYPVETEKKLLKNLIGNLRPVDKFNVMLFAGSSTVVFDHSMPATKENLKAAINIIESQSGGGGTELLPALQKALALEKSEGFSRTFVITTDGYVDIEKETFDLIKKSLNNSNFFAFGIGTSVNRYLIEGMAHAGMGEPFIVTEEKDCEKKAEKFRTYIQTPVLTEIKTDYSGFNVYDVEPTNIPDVLAERPIIIFGKWKGEAKGVITIKGKNGNGDFNWNVDVSEITPSAENKALKYLWARQKIRMMDDYNNISSDTKLQEEITGLGLKYNLLTNYTSFVAIDSMVRNKSGKSTTVKQPLPMPEKVSDYAVGGTVSGMGMACYSVSGRSSTHKTKSPSYNTKNAAEAITEDLVEQQDISVNDSPRTIVETMPEFIGGQDSLMKFIVKNTNYPEAAKTAGISGTVYISFVVEADGKVTDVQLISDIGGGCGAEAVRVVTMTSGKWIPGKENGKAVRVKFNLPVKFLLK